MIPVRRKIELQEGVEVPMLFTPHLYSYKGQHGITFETDANDSREVASHFADLFFCAALNAWELDDEKDPADFPYRRGDFHAAALGNGKEFADCIAFALRALTGKSAEELVKEGEAKAKEKGTAAGDAGGKKKARSSWIGRLLRRSS